MALEALKKAFLPGQVLVAGNEEYAKVNGSYLSALQSEMQPAGIVQPKDKDEVAKFVQVIQPYVSSGECHVAIRGGGQQPTPGCSNVEGGITLDLSGLKGIDIKGEIVSIGAGERWGVVYDKLDSVGRGVTGSRSSKGGIGGLALEGGLSFFSSREGFICDNVVNYEVVLSDGRTINANSSENSDLWVALKGGANNFGIVTRYDMRTFEQGKFWGGNVFYFPPSFPNQIEAMAKEIQNPNADPDTHLMVSIGYAAQFGQTMCQNQIYYTKPVEHPSVMKPFADIQPQIDQLNSLSLKTLKELTDEQAGLAMDGVRCAYMNTTLKANEEMLQRAAEIYSASIENVKLLEGVVCSLTFEPFPVSLMQKSIELGGNSLGLDPSEGPLVLVLLLTYWKNKEDDEKVLGEMKETISSIEREANSKHQASRYKLMNYSFSDQEAINSYGSEQKKSLQAVSKKYDVDQFFQKGVPGGFKLFD